MLLLKIPNSGSVDNEDLFFPNTTLQESDILPVFRSKGYVPEDVSEKGIENPPMKRQKTASITEEDEESISNVKGISRNIIMCALFMTSDLMSFVHAI